MLNLAKNPSRSAETSKTRNSPPLNVKLHSPYEQKQSGYSNQWIFIFIQI